VRVPLVTTFSGLRPATLPNNATDPTYFWSSVVVSEQNDINKLRASILSNASHVAQKEGKWSSPSTWSSGKIPDIGSTVHIPSGIAVQYDVSSDKLLKDILWREL